MAVAITFFATKTPPFMRIKSEKECITMMEFIIMTLSFTAAILLSSVVACVIMLQPKALKWLFKYYVKQMNKMDDILEDVI